MPSVEFVSLRLTQSTLGALVVLVALLLAAPADARTGPCRADGSGPTCRIWTGKVDFVADGDTIDVDVAGDGTSRPVRIRITGLNAMELSVYSRRPSRRRGECHARAAAARLDQLVRRGRSRVRLAALQPASRSGSRPRRAVAVRIAGGWQEVAATLLAEGHALWLPNRAEWAWNASYRQLALDAAAARLRLWDPESCRPGPGTADQLAVGVQWDADGRDDLNLNGEWIDVENRGGTDIRLAGWWVRDSHLRRYRFPSGATVAPGERVRVHVGSGSSGGRDFYWGLGAPAFENATHDRLAMGDGGYLFDPHGDLRGWDIYPRSAE
jgi:micrococcal nuclease